MQQKLLKFVTGDTTILLLKDYLQNVKGKKVKENKNKEDEKDNTRSDDTS